MGRGELRGRGCLAFIGRMGGQGWGRHAGWLVSLHGNAVVLQPCARLILPCQAIPAHVSGRPALRWRPGLLPRPPACCASLLPGSAPCACCNAACKCCSLRHACPPAAAACSRTWRQRLSAHKACATQAGRQGSTQQVDAGGGQARQGALHAIHLPLILEGVLMRNGS